MAQVTIDAENPKDETGMVPTMTALQVPGPLQPADLVPVSANLPTRSRSDVLVAVRAAGVNRSDVLACQGVIPGPYPRVLGREYAGEVVDGPAEWVGRRVWGAGGGDLGVTRDGTHAEYVAIPLGALVEIPTALETVDAGASALAYFTAQCAIMRATGRSGLKGTWVAVTGAAGSVGRAACELARLQGARVVAIVKDRIEAQVCHDFGYEDIVRTDSMDVTRSIRELTNGAGADAAVDAVGGAMSDALLGALKAGGGLCVFSSPAEQPISLDVLSFYRNDLLLVGLNTARLTMYDAAGVLRDLASAFDSGKLRPVSVHSTRPLSEASIAYTDVMRAVAGRPVLCPAPAAAR
ncbi:NADPH2:quinone reductase [Thermocatellispora tengchongensis]|uniref:NADPH2:quinone reductase n=1 Tax=Thermocatellispora tengchongensis TaxID=1073253 RepID=A0A840PM59_9ACTN|nr:zinc-binding alcohol dehydrogenase family protein [Thermocatellispora tengchongensis]MBB5140578.1 NADPH2:quinone reductase [Thermocatellispora tengchongensis]